MTDTGITKERSCQPTPIPLDQVDLTDLDAFARNEGWAMFDTLRARGSCALDPGGPTELAASGR